MPHHVGLIASLPDELRPVVRRLHLQRVFDRGRTSERGRAAGSVNGHRVSAVLAGVGTRSAADAALALLAEGCDLLCTLGFAGGLDPALASGDVIAVEAVGRGNEWLTATWIGPGRRGRCITCPQPVGTTPAKQALFAATGAAVADMESAAVAEAAIAAGVGWFGLRAVSDDAGHTLPLPVLRAIRPDLGRVLVGPLVLRAAVDARLWLPMVRLAVSSTRAGRALADALATTLEELS